MTVIDIIAMIRVASFLFEMSFTNLNPKSGEYHQYIVSALYDCGISDILV
jgi:hypothetical protein